jgi:hypothetical protein
MTDEAPRIDPELVELLDGLAKGQKRYQRLMRWNAIMLTAGIALITLLDLAMVWAGGGRWVIRDALQVSGLGVLGLVACWGLLSSSKMIVTRDAELLERMRQCGQLATTLEEVTPLLHAIRDAHARGAALVIPPHGPDGEPNSPFATDHTVH